MLAPLAATSALAAPALTEDTIAVDERVPVVLLVLTPGASVPGARTSDLQRIAAEVLRRKTDLNLLSLEQAGADAARIADCHGKLGCWVRAVRPDYDRLQTELPTDTSYPRFLIALSILAKPGAPERLSAVLLETDAVLAFDHAFPRSGAGWEEKLENRVFELAEQSPPVTADLSDAARVRAYFERLFESEWRGAFEKSGHWEPHGAVLITCSIAGRTIELDGAAVGVTRKGTTRLTGVAPGKRRITVAGRSGRAPFEATVEVTPGASAAITAEVEAEERPAGAGAIVRGATFWSGVGLAAIGVGLSTYAAVATPSKIAVCLDAPGGGSGLCPPEREFLSFCELSSDDPAACGGSKGVLVAPLGFSFIGAGGAWALGSALFGGEDDVPWIPLAAGLVLGAVAYGVSAALGG